MGECGVKIDSRTQPKGMLGGFYYILCIVQQHIISTERECLVKRESYTQLSHERV